jgi:hypothetical protein
MGSMSISFRNQPRGLALQLAKIRGGGIDQARL